jgi:hypothetical protein
MNISTIPSTNGCSGPTIVKSILFLIAKFNLEILSFKSMFSHLCKRLVPALPGDTNIFEILLFCNNFHANACSLPPLPINNNFIFI